MKDLTCDPPEICGTTVLGERGQIVIPKALRESLRLKKGDVFMMMRHGQKLMLIPSRELKEMISHMNSAIASISKSI